MAHFTFPISGDSVFPIDGTSDESTAILFTIPNTNLAFKAFLVQVHVVTVSGFTSGPSISLGTNASNYDNVMPVTAITPTVGGKMQNILLTNADILDANDVLRVRVATAASASVYLMRATIIGHFV